MALKTIDGLMLRDMLVAGSALLNANRAEVDRLNVFPVPDGDTGTNMSQTMNAAVKDLAQSHIVSAAEVAALAARGALRGARGNSGVILSQILRGFASAIDGHDEIGVSLLADAFKSGAATAYKAVMKPKEGTILTVARAMAEEADRSRNKTDDVIELFGLALKSGEEILKRTPDMLPVLKQAGVVDSGGKGLTVVYNGFYSALSGNMIDAPDDSAVFGEGAEFVDDHASLSEITFGYCTEFIVSRPKEELTNAAVNRLRKRLERIGDCVFVVSDLTVVKVHVHTNDPGKALQYALELGEIDNIKIDNMLEEHREVLRKREEAAAAEAAAKAELKKYGIVAVTLGEGLTELFKSIMVDVVVDGGQTMNPCAEDLQKAIEATNAENVFVLPNNGNIILAAQQAAEFTDKKVFVLPTKSVPMGISAALAFDPEAEPEDNESMMKEAAERVHTASITYSVRDTVFDDMQIHEGDIMGMVDNKISVLGTNVEDVAMNLLSGMVNDDIGIITVYYGKDISEETASALVERISEAYPDCEADLQNGGQPLYYYLISVE